MTPLKVRFHETFQVHGVRNLLDPVILDIRYRALCGGGWGGDKPEVLLLKETNSRTGKVNR